jgi:D-alanyl-D-alanine-carboxypeptidase/D-alanyl-D-alanine-endopeptidase
MGTVRLSARRTRPAICAALALVPLIGVPSDADIRRILAERVGSLENGVAMVVAVVGPQGRRLIAYGRVGANASRAVGGDTGFEIGSVTKVFTALLLAEMVVRGEVALADPVERYLPAGTQIHTRNGRSITLVELATHTSGLPFMPDDIPALNDPAARYAALQLYRFLARYQPLRDVGAGWEYSNVGYWLLGEALAARAGRDFEGLLRARVLVPLGLKRTGFTLSPAQKARLSPGHDASLDVAPAVSSVPVFAAMPAAGGLVSTAGDLSTFLAVAMGYQRSPLAPAMAAMLRTRRPAAGPGAEQALGWMVLRDDAGELIVHDGGTFGYASSVAWDPSRRLGVVVLSNEVSDVSDIARHLLRPAMPLAKRTARRRIEIDLDPALLDGYAGRYEAEGEAFVIARDGGFLTIQLPVAWGLPKLRLRPESPRDFFVSELPLRVMFQTDRAGRASAVVIHPPRGQDAIRAPRVTP